MTLIVGIRLLGVAIVVSVATLATASAAPRYMFTVSGGGPLEPRAGLLASDTSTYLSLLARTGKGGFVGYGTDNRVWEVTSDGRIHPRAGNGGPPGALRRHGPALKIPLADLSALATGRDGSIYLGTNVISQVTPTGYLRRIAGRGPRDAPLADGQLVETANLRNVLSLLELEQGRLLVGLDSGLYEIRNGRIWLVSEEATPIYRMRHDGPRGVLLEGPVDVWRLSPGGRITHVLRPCVNLSRSCDQNGVESRVRGIAPLADGGLAFSVGSDLFTTRDGERFRGVGSLGTGRFGELDHGDGGPARRAGVSFISDLEVLNGDNILVASRRTRIITGRNAPLLVAARPAQQTGQPCAGASLRYRLTRPADIRVTLVTKQGHSLKAAERGRRGINRIRLPFLVPRGLLRFRILASTPRRATSAFGQFTCR